MEKFSLIDLETRQRATGRKQAQAVQRERLSERTSFAGGCDSLNSDYNQMKSESGIRSGAAALKRVVTICVIPILWMGNLVVSNRSLQGVLKA